MKRIYKTKELADEYNCARITVIGWCRANGVAFTGEGHRREYQITEADKKRFEKRPKPGKRAKKKL